MRVLILGGTGLIGSAILQELILRGHEVTAIARDPAVARRRQPQARWVNADLAQLSTVEAWRPFLKNCDAVVNCAGALQDGARDDVVAVQKVAMRALYAAGAQLRLIVQISARTDGTGSSTPFMASKRCADQALAQSGVPFVILRPAIVIGRHAYGGSALLRALAAFPAITPLPDSAHPLPFASLDDVVRAVADALAGDIDPGSDIEIAGPRRHRLSEAVALHRQWLGLPPASVVPVPRSLASVTAFIADMLGLLGWRSPMRSTAVSIAGGALDAEPTSSAWQGLEDVLEKHPAGVADLWFARLYLLKPVIIATLSLFWLASGIVALFAFHASAAHLEAIGMQPDLAQGVTVGTSLADVLLGILVLVRRCSAVALKAMIGLSIAYLAAATFTAPALWVDPLGPLVKVFPSILLSLVALAILDER